MLRGEKENAINYLNVAIEIDPYMYKKAEKEPVFIPIKAHMNFPNLEEVEPKPLELTKKEKKVQKHLEETTKIVGKLSRNEQTNKKEYKEIRKDIQKEREE